MDIHIVPGDSAAGTVKRALGPRNKYVVGLSDLLSVGPLAQFSHLEAWASLRLGFLRGVLLYDHLTVDKLIPNVAALRDSRVTTVWLGTGPADQIALAWLCALMRVVDIDLERLRVIQFPPDFVDGHCLPSLGILTPEQVRLHPPAVQLSRPELATLDDAWAAVTASTPEALVNITRSSNGPLPTLRRALERLISRYPDVDSGLSRWDGILLRDAKMHGPSVLHVIANALAGDAWDNDPVGDMWLYWRLRRLASTWLPYPLLELSGEPADYRAVTVRLTEAGHAVARSETTALMLNGIDDHVGGVHLSSAFNHVWVTEKGHLIRLEQPPTPAA